jgi:hypothetical protein
LDGGEDTTRATLVLVDAIFYVFVEKETLLPGIVEMAFSVLKK